MLMHTTSPLHAGLKLLAALPAWRTTLGLLPLLAFGQLPTAKADSTAAMENTCETAAAAGPSAAPGGGGSAGGSRAAPGGAASPGGQGGSGLAPLLAKLLGPNEFASGGLTLMLVGAAAAAARLALSHSLSYARRHVMITAEIDSRDDAYRWLMHFLASQDTFRRATVLSVTTNLTSFGTAPPQQPLLSPAVASDADADADGCSRAPVLYLPGPGDHMISYKGKLMWLSRRRANGNPQLAANARLLLETVRISMLGTSRWHLDQLLSDAAASYNTSQSSRTIVHSVDPDGYWAQIGSRPIRPLSTVVLPPGKADELLSDCKEFLASEDWYAHHGIPYRRGYLLYGPPGTGKTSLVMALAGALALEIYVVTLSSPTLHDEGLRQLLNSASPRSILLLEDVDAAFVERAAAGGGAAGLSFSGLLNAIDGVAAQEGRLLFMTTNHIDRLSSALIRPGRVDVRCFLGHAAPEQARAMFFSFYHDLPHLQLLPGGTGSGQAASAASASTRARAAEREAVLQQLAGQFADALLENAGGFSMAQLQGHLMRHRKDPFAAAANVRQLAAQQATEQQEERGER